MANDAAKIGGFAGAIIAGLLTTVIYNWYESKKNPGQVGTIASNPPKAGIAEQTNPITAPAPSKSIGGLGAGRGTNTGAGVHNSQKMHHPGPSGLGSGLGSQPENNPAQGSNFLSATSPVEMAAAAYMKIANNTRATNGKVQRSLQAVTAFSGGPDCGS